MDTANISSYFVIICAILSKVSLTNQAINTGHAVGTDAIEPGYFFAKFASKLSDINFRVSRRSNTVYNANEERNGKHLHCSQLRGSAPREIGPWPRSTGTGGVSARGARNLPKAAALTVTPSSLFNNSNFGNLMKVRCKSSTGFPDCFEDEIEGDNLLQDAVTDYAKFAEQWLPDCTITCECSKLVERGNTDWFSSRWTRISSNRSSALPVCYEMADLRELSPERKESWWFDFCCFTGAICEPFSSSGAGWGKLLARDNSSASQVSRHLQILHDTTCPSNKNSNNNKSNSETTDLDPCITEVIIAWNILSGPTSQKIRSDALTTLVRCDPDLWMNPVWTFEWLLNKLADEEIQTIHDMFDDLITTQKGTASHQIMHSSGKGPIMKRHEFELGPRAVSGIVVVVVLIVLSVLVGAWAVHQRVQSWRHPRNHIQYAPIYMEDDELDGGGSHDDNLETVGGWSRVEDLGRGDASDAEPGRRGNGGGA